MNAVPVLQDKCNRMTKCLKSMIKAKSKKNTQKQCCEAGAGGAEIIRDLEPEPKVLRML